MIKHPKVEKVDMEYPPDHIFDFEKEIYKFPLHNGEINVFKAKHQRIYFDHQLKIKSLEIPKKCDVANGRCKNKCKKNNTCPMKYERAVARICPENCNCKYRCLCGWTPDDILPDNKKNKQIAKHFKMCIALEYLGEQKERTETQSVRKHTFL